MFVRYSALLLVVAGLAVILSACGTRPQPDLGESRSRFQRQISSIPYPSTAISIQHIDSYINAAEPEVLLNRITLTTGDDSILVLHEQTGFTISEVTTQTHTPLGSTAPISATTLLSNVNVDQFAAAEIALRDMKLTMADCDNFQIVAELDSEQRVTWVVFATCAQSMSYSIDAQTGAILNRTRLK